MKLQDTISSVVENSESSWPTYDGEQLDRSKFVTASEVANCLRRIKFGKVAAARNLPPRRGSWGFAQRGHSVEAWVVSKLRGSNAGANFMFLGDQQVSFHDGDQSGTPDGLIIPTTHKILFDIKSFDPRKNVSKMPDNNHIWQVTQNIDLVQRCLGYDIPQGKILYVNASNFEDMHEFDFDFDEELAMDLRERAARVMAAESPEDLPAEGMFNGGCQYCTFKEHCSGAEELAAKERKLHAKRKGIANGVFG